MTGKFRDSIKSKHSHNNKFKRYFFANNNQKVQFIENDKIRIVFWNFIEIQRLLAVKW